MKKIIIVLMFLVLISGCAKINLDLPNSNSSNTTNEFEASEDELVAHFIDVGQGDANFIELPNGDTMLIDAGESYESDTVIDYIENLGYTDIDYVIGTHPHTDHIGGLADVINTFNVTSIYMPKAVSTSKTYENLLETIKDKGLSIHTGKAGVEVLSEDNLSIEMLAPNAEKYSSMNNYSIVLKITYGNISFLYTGDAEALSEKEITADVEADVLKVGHHGSDTSSSDDFLARVNPSYAIISVGANNSYNHPSSSTIEKLEKYTNNIYRTDLNGSIIVKSDGINIEVETEK